MRHDTVRRPYCYAAYIFDAIIFRCAVPDISRSPRHVSATLAAAFFFFLRDISGGDVFFTICACHGFCRYEALSMLPARREGAIYAMISFISSIFGYARRYIYSFLHFMLR